MSEEATHRHRSHRHRRRHSDHRWSARSKLLLGALCAALLGIFFLILFFGIKVYSLNQENEALRLSVRQQEAELVRLRPEIERMRGDFDALVHQRLPGLIPLEYDRVIALDSGYVKNIVFTLAGTGGSRRYEYKLVMENHALSPLWPRVRVLLFDERGIQVAGVEIGGDEGAVLRLAPGEVRSHVETIVTRGGETPRYFQVEVPAEGGSVPGSELNAGPDGV